MCDGLEYVDWTGGLGANLTYAHNNFGLPHVDEVILGERLQELIPILQKMRFLKTGSEACQAAVRIARAYIRNNGLNSFTGVGHSYHGWHNWCIAAEQPGAGTVDERYFKWDIDTILTNIKAGLDIGYVIIEPVMLDMSEEHIAKLRELRRLCTEKQIVLIFDEVITGFRTPKYCMAQYLNIEPDLICLGKALGNGYPLAVVGGRSDIMETEGWFISSTHAGEHSAIGNALNTLDFIYAHPIEDLWISGTEFKNSFNAISPNIQLFGLPTRSIWKCTDEYRALFFQETCKLGLLFGAGWWITYAHTKEICAETIDKCREAIGKIDRGEVKLQGKPIRPVFKRV
jgi:glutamate-1-semialdehyde aminotransferase